MINGTVQSQVSLKMLDMKWQKKKTSSEVLSKEELNKREKWTPEERMLNDYKEQLKNQKEGNKRSEIYNKISSGQKLSPEEEQYLASFDPKSLSEYKQTQAERKAYEEKLKNCKTKDEVHRLKQTKLGVELTSFKSIVNDPHIPISEKLKKAQQTMGKTINIEEAESEFVQSGEYDKLPSEAEQDIQRAKENSAENKINEALVEEASRKEKENLDDTNKNDEVQENHSSDIKESEQKLNEIKDVDNSSLKLKTQIEEIYNSLVLRKQLEDDSNKQNVVNQEKSAGKKINVSV